VNRPYEVPAIVEEALAAAARRRLPPELCGGAALTAAVVDRSRRYTSERENLADPGGARASLADLAARALFFTVADAAKVHLPLGELASGALPGPAGFLGGETLTVLDVGAGCGAMTLGLVTWLAAHAPHLRVRATLVDQDANALAIAKDAIEVVGNEVGVWVRPEPRLADASTTTFGPTFDLVLAGTVVNELADPMPAVRAMIAALAPAGVAIIIEPALRATTRSLHRVRDTLLAGDHAAVLAPCTRKAAPCPALADERDWCHEHRPLHLPPRTRQIATNTGLRDGDMKLAYLTLCRPDAAPAPPDTWRVVSDPHASKGKLELTLCGTPGWVPARLLKRHRAPANRAIERAHRGDVLSLDPAPTADDPDITAATTATTAAEADETLSR
jgi:SAM-dependent methyltransferase